MRVRPGGRTTFVAAARRPSRGHPRGHDARQADRANGPERDPAAAEPAAQRIDALGHDVDGRPGAINDAI